MAVYAKEDNQFNLHEHGFTINGDNVAGFTSPTNLNNIRGYGDFTNVITYMVNGKTDKEQMEKYLGMFQLFQTTHQESVPMVADLVKDMAVMTLEDHEKATYDIMIPTGARSNAKALTDGTNQFQPTDEIVSGVIFDIVLDRKFVPGDALKFNLTQPYTVIVSREYDITPVGAGWKHTVEYVNMDKKKVFPMSALRAGVEWFRLSHHMAEYGKDWASPTLLGESPGKLRLEVYMPSPQGIETAYTMRGGNISSDQMGNLAKSTQDYLTQELNKLGGFDKAGTFFLGKTTASGKGFSGKPKVALTLEYLALKELVTMNAFTNMFGDQITQANEDGVVRAGEGAWFQCRRGKVITYPRPGGLKIPHLAEASSYVFKNSNIPLENRHIEFKGGREAVANGLEILREYSNNYINTLPPSLVGANGILNERVVSGSLDDLSVNLIRFGKALIPSVGWVTFKHDPSFDFQPFGRRQDVGFTTNGYNNLSYSLMVDGIEVRKSNTYKNVHDATLIDGGSKNSNFYYLKPENHIWWGRTHGRMNDGDKFTDLKASLRFMGTEFWAAMQSYILMVDTTAKVVIEVQNTYDYY